MKRPLAYITAAWCGDPDTDMELAARYCRMAYEAGFSPICPMRTRNSHHPQTKRPPSKIALDERSGIVFGFARRLGMECCALRS